MRHRPTSADDEPTRRNAAWPGAGRRATVSSSGRRRRQAERESRGWRTARGAGDRWLVSYADLITLLFAFFTTMYAASSVDALKMSSMVQSMQVAFDAAPGAASVTRRAQPARGEAIPPPATDAPAPIDVEAYRVEPIPLPTSGHVPGWLDEPDQADGPPVDANPPADQSSLTRVLARLSQQLGEEIVTGRVSLEMDRRGLIVSIRETGTFETGRADLSASARRLVTRLAEPLGALANPIRVEGHTDDVPIHTARYESNWELSTARAVNVVAFLVQEMDFDAARLSAAGYSEFRPRFSNDSVWNRARNRRVDLIVLDPDVSRAEEPAGAEGVDD